MAYKIVVSGNAETALDSILYYLDNKWSKKTSDDFVTIFIKKIAELSLNPKIGKKTDLDESIRKIVITKHNILYYQVISDEIYLLDIIFAKQNPDKNKYE